MIGIQIPNNWEAVQKWIGAPKKWPLIMEYSMQTL